MPAKGGKGFSQEQQTERTKEVDAKLAAFTAEVEEAEKKGLLKNGPDWAMLKRHLDDKDLKVLNRIIRYTSDGIGLGAGLRHAELIIEQLGA